MFMKKISKLLKKIGLLDSEVDTYLALLELGPSTVLEIAHKIQFSRQSIYTALEGLKSKVLVGVLDEEKRVKYVAESPNILLSFAENRLTEMKTIVKEVKEKTKELKLLQKGEKPIVRMFEGDEVIELAGLFATKAKYVDEFINIDVINEHRDQVKKANTVFKKTRTPNQIKVLTLDNKKTLNTDDFSSHEMVKIINDSDINFKGTISINPEQILLETFENKRLSILIDSKILAQTMRQLFDLAWKNNSNKKFK